MTYRLWHCRIRGPVFKWTSRTPLFWFFRERAGWRCWHINYTQLAFVNNLPWLLVELPSWNRVDEWHDVLEMNNCSKEQIDRNNKKWSVRVGTSAALISWVAAPFSAATLWTRNLSLHCRSGGASLCACIVTNNKENAKDTCRMKTAQGKQTFPCTKLFIPI